MRFSSFFILSSSVSIVAFIVGLGTASAIVGEQALRRDKLIPMGMLRDADGLTGPMLSTKALEMLQTDLFKVAKEHTTSLALKIVVERLSFQRDTDFVYTDISLSDAVGQRQLNLVIDGFDEAMNPVLSFSHSFSSTGLVQAMRVKAPMSALAQHLSVRFTDISGEDVPMFSHGDVAEEIPKIGPDSPLIARDALFMAGLLGKYFGRSDLVVGQGIERYVDDFRSELGLESGPGYATLGDLYALRIYVGETSQVDLFPYYKWRLAAKYLQGRRLRPDAPVSGARDKADSGAFQAGSRGSGKGSNASSGAAEYESGARDITADSDLADEEDI